MKASSYLRLHALARLSVPATRLHFQNTQLDQQEPHMISTLGVPYNS